MHASSRYGFYGALVVMALITLANVSIATLFVVSADSALIVPITGNNVFIVGAIELLILFGAYMAAKYEPIPSPD